MTDSLQNLAYPGAAAGHEDDDLGHAPSQAEHLLASLRALEESETGAASASLVPFRLDEFSGETIVGRSSRDAQLELSIELGHTRMSLDEAAALGAGTVVTLDESPADPVDVLVGGRLVARGELVVMQEKFCVRITELVGRRAAA